MTSPRARRLSFEACEERCLTTLVFILNGNALGAAHPDALTADAARVLNAAGLQTVQLAYPAIGTPAAFDQLARTIERASGGAPIGLVGFSAGGTLATRLAGVADLHVAAVLDEYGPPDARDYFNYHGNDHFAHYVRKVAHPNAALIDRLSGPLHTSAYVDAAFGLDDPNVIAAVSTASFEKDVPRGQVFDYVGGHGVSIEACPAALQDFLTHI